MAHHCNGATSGYFLSDFCADPVAQRRQRADHQASTFRTDPCHQALIDGALEVGQSLFFALLIITVSFLPVFTLENLEGRQFKPLAFTTTFSMAGAALLPVTQVWISNKTSGS